MGGAAVCPHTTSFHPPTPHPPSYPAPPPHPTPPTPLEQVLLSLKRAHLIRKIGRANIHINVADAVARATSLAQQQEKEKNVEGV